MVGGKSEFVAVDESGVGRLGYMVGKAPTKGGKSKRKLIGKQRIAKTLPCCTKWKRNAKPGRKQKAGTAADKRHGNRWLCGARSGLGPIWALMGPFCLKNR